MRILSLLDIVTEADKDEATDYTKSDTPTDDEASNYTEEVPDGPEEEDDEEETTDTDEPSEDPPTDYTEDETPAEEPEETPEPSADETPAQEPPEEAADANETTRTITLYQDMVDLYLNIKNMHERVSKADMGRIDANNIVVKVADLLYKLKDETYIYIVNSMRKKSYVLNLYKYNQIIETIKLLINVLNETKVVIDDPKETKKSNLGQSKSK